MIRRVMAILLAVWMLFSCAMGEGELLRGYDAKEGYVYVAFGSYPQVIEGGDPLDGNQTWTWRAAHQAAEKEKKKTGTEYDPGEVTPTPILWRVISAENGQALLMSEYILFASTMHPSTGEYRKVGADFGATGLSAKLNGEFAETAFSEKELNCMVPLETFGKVFIPDSKILKDKTLGFGTNKSRLAWATEYAIRVTGAYVYQPFNGNHTPYWLREQSENQKTHARSIKKDGSIGKLGATGDDMGARPMIILEMDRIMIDGGEGTIGNPYAIRVKEQ